MAFKFNPFTGTFDEVGTGGGGVPDPLTLNELTVNTLLTADHIHGNLAGSVYIHVKNTDSVQLDAGTPFYITGTVGASDRVEVQKADSSDPAKGPAVGVLETTLAINGEGNGVILGEIFNFDTATPNWSTNDPLYVANGGGLTNVKPTSGYRQIIAYVGRIQASTGTLVLTGTSVDPVAGSNTQIQYNDNGGFGASTDLTWNNTSKELGVGGDLNLDSGGSFSTTIQSVTPTANRTISFPDATGTVALVSGANGTIQYNDAGTLNGNSDFTVDPDWNDASTVFTGLKLNVTDTASAAGSNLVDIQSNGTSDVVIDSSGRVGINTTSPSAPLSVQASSTAEGIKILGRAADDIGDFAFLENDGTTEIGRIQARTTELSFRARQSGQSILFITGGIAERARIDSSGNLGIATSTPDDKLEIGGAGAGIILASPDGTRYRLTVANGGTLSIAAV